MPNESSETSSRAQGAELTSDGVRYRTWCKHHDVRVNILDSGKRVLRSIKLQPEGDGYFSGTDASGRAGDFYRYQFGASESWPDPASRWQPQGVHGSSMVIDPNAYAWKDQDWRAPAYADLIIYELHVGTFTAEGTFRAAVEKLPMLRELGVNAIELMPIADFPGDRNWGYDGVSLYAPSRAYGHPDDLRSLVDAAHAQELAVILDVVYNHLGPDGNYIGVYHDGYFTAQHETPWGAGLHFEEKAVREFFADNAPYWMREFHIDGFRLDATHAIADSSPRHILAEITDRVHARGGFLVAEDERNAPAVLRPSSDGGLGFDGVWSDDFHHVVRVMLTGVRQGYYENFSGTPNELTETLQHGWLYRGQRQRADGSARGGESIGFPPECFIYCISNHDQIGNRAFGERIGHVVKPAAYRAVSALICLVPYTPMLFMGQEWNASSPFQFFTDHNAELGLLITKGRRKEFESFAEFSDPEVRETIPDPQSLTTFENSKLRWKEADEPGHAAIRALYCECLRLRKTHPAFRHRARKDWQVELTPEKVILLRMNNGCVLAIDLVGNHSSPPALAEMQHVFSSNEERFGGDNERDFSGPTTALFQPA